MPRRQVVSQKTAYELFVERWSDGCGSSLCAGARKVVLARGCVPCDVLFVGEAPGECCSGNTLIETAFRDKSVYPYGVPIQDLVGRSGFEVYSFVDGSIQPSTVRKVWMTGFRVVYRVTYFWWGGKQDGRGGRHKYHGSIEVTDNHPFLLRSREYRSISCGLKVGDRLMPFYRNRGKYHFIGLASRKMEKESRLLMEHKLGRPLESGEDVHHEDRNKWNDTESNLILLDHVDHAREHAQKENPMHDPDGRASYNKATQSVEYANSLKAAMQKVFADPEARRRRKEQNRRVAGKTSDTVREKFANDPVYYYRYLRGRQSCLGATCNEQWVENKFRSRFPEFDYPPEDDNHQIEKIERLGVKAVYDMEVESHNFAANGIFVHNSENVTGVPFVGPAGHLLDHIVDRALAPDGMLLYSVAFCNVVGCIPRDAEGGKVADPAPADVKACAPRLREFVELANPRLIVCVGTVARKWLDPKSKGRVALPRDIHMTDISHPAYILRANIAQRTLLVQRAIVTIATAAQEYLE